MPSSGIRPEPDIDTINPLTAHTIEGHNQANLEIEAEGKEDWRSNIRISDTYLRYRFHLEELLEPFYDMWDGHLGHIKATVNRIELKPDSKRMGTPHCLRTEEGRHVTILY